MKCNLCLILSILLVSSCALFKKDRVLKNRASEKEEYGFHTFFYPTKTKSKTLIIFFSGDGGWLDFDDNLCRQFADNGIETLGVNSRSYFWKESTPQATAKQLRILVRFYLRQLNPTQMYLGGYSFGADVTPFIYNEMPFFMKRHTKKLILLSPFATTDFKVHLADLLGNGYDNYKYSVSNEIAKIKIPVLCFYGKDEQKPLSFIKQKNFKIQLLKGNHRYNDEEIPKILNSVLVK